ncbi:uncharacterized protein V6R79_017414 [Siganus canaliculatus]
MTLFTRMLLIVLLLSLTLAATGQDVEEDWLDPFDMVNYDPGTKTMRKPAEPASYPNVPTKRKPYDNSGQAEPASCDKQVADLHKQIEELKRMMKVISQQPTCCPVFKRFLNRLLTEVKRVGLPSDSADACFDAHISLSKVSISEIESFLRGEESWRTGALDNAISRILVDLRHHDSEAWKWRFEDTFGVDLDTVLKAGLLVMVIAMAICTQLWSVVSWFVQVRRLLAVSFFISIIWNWFYLYKIAFAEHQKTMATMDGVSDKCTGLKKVDWTDSLKEFFRGTFTLQDDPCKKYYEVLFVNPLLLVPPTKAISVTIVTFITEPLKHIGEGISDFIRALLKDLPVTLQIPVFLTVVLGFVVFMYGGVQAAFQHGITAPFRRRPRGPRPPQLQQPQRYLQGVAYQDQIAGGDAPQHPPNGNNGRLQRNQVRQRRPNRPRENAAKVVVETLHTAEPPYSENETDSAAVQNLSAESDSDNGQETEEEVLVGASAADIVQGETEAAESVSAPPGTKACKGTAACVGAKTPSKTTPKKSDLSQTDTKSMKSVKNSSKGALSEEDPDMLLSQRDVQNLQASVENGTSSDLQKQVETVGVPVQESSPTQDQ